MIPFAPSMFANEVEFVRRVVTTSDRGAVTYTWPGPGDLHMANIQPMMVQRSEPDGIIRNELEWHVFTPTDLMAVEGDQFLWEGRTFSALGPTIDRGAHRGASGVIWVTRCTEVI